MKEFGSHVTLDNPAWIHDSVSLYGKIRISEGASLWPNVVIRSEVHSVFVGHHTNIQDFVLIHVGLKSGTRIGHHCTIGHHCVLHGCTIGNNTLIGIRATLMEKVTIGNNCIIAPHTYIKEGTIIPDNSIVQGNPARVVRQQSNYLANRVQAMLNHENARAYAEGNHRRLSAPDFQELALSWLEKIRTEMAASGIKANPPENTEPAGVGGTESEMPPVGAQEDVEAVSEAGQADFVLDLSDAAEEERRSGKTTTRNI